MKKGLRSTLALLLGAALIAMPVTQVKAETKPTLNYVALGDSIAAGVLYSPNVTNYGSIKTDKGYTNDLSAILESAGFTVKFNNDFCLPGMTAIGLAEQSKALNDPNTPIYSSIHNAQLITLDVGANDLLGVFYNYVFANKDKLMGTPPDPLAVAGLKTTLNGTLQNLYFGTAGTEVQENIEIILQKILKANPKAQIYVMGYYNPLPILKNYGMDLTFPTAYFNTFIYKAICNVRAKNRGASISYVETLLPMADGVNRGLLYPQDIHPTEIGYKLIANLFWQRIKLNYLITQYINTRVG